MTFISLCLIHLLAVMSPGPGFAIAFRNSLKGGILKGVLTAAGIALGDLVLLVLSVSGASLIITQFPELMRWLQILGAVYLGYLGFKALLVFFRHLMKKDTLVPELELNSHSFLECFQAGFTLTILNPKAIIYFISISSQFMHLTTSLSVRISYSLILILITFFWFSFVAVFVGNNKTRNLVSKYQYFLDGLMGIVLVLYCVYALMNY